ncbi:MAG: hypothetical protein II920_08900 [Clostridia bacterium]|nr:hypothetical protein [Clostridia bacterium]
MIIDLSSPIELRGYEILHDDNGTARAYIDLFNVERKTVTGYSGTARWMRDGFGEGANEYISVDKMSIPGGGEFRLTLSSSAVRYADRLEIYFSSVTFEDGSVWTPVDGELVDVGESVPLEGSELDMLRQLAGEDAVMYPETQDNFWRCVCGRINPLTEHECARCKREMNYVLSELNRKAVKLPTRERNRRARRRAAFYAAAGKKPDDNTGIYMALMAVATAAFLLACVIIVWLK